MYARGLQSQVAIAQDQMNQTLQTVDAATSSLDMPNTHHRTTDDVPPFAARPNNYNENRLLSHNQRPWEDASSRIDRRLPTSGVVTFPVRGDKTSAGANEGKRSFHERPLVPHGAKSTP